MKIFAGCAENEVTVPLFAELGGYGPFKGRRNIGVRDPLYCRVLTVNNGSRRNMLVVTDTIASDESLCRQMRMELATKYAVFPESILFAATHTHSGACLCSCDVGYGERSEEFVENWKAAVRKTAAEAIQSEEPVRAFAGRAPVREALGARRTTDTDKHTDPEIRFIKFVREDGSVKILLHNHAMHGVVFGPLQLKASADWMGEVNRRIKAEKLADLPFFLYGTAGDVNVIWRHRAPEERYKDLEFIGSHYTADLAAGLENCREIDLSSISASLKTVELPSEKVDSAEYRAIAEKLLQKLPSPFEKLLQYIHDRMIEMAVMVEHGHDFRVIRDLQVLRMGDWMTYAIPGEPFLAVGEELMAKSGAAFPMAVSVANGDAGYYPTRKMFEQYPTIFDSEDFGAFGFYEVWFGAGLLRPKFKPEVVEFLVNELLTTGRQLEK